MRGYVPRVRKPSNKYRPYETGSCLNHISLQFPPAEIFGGLRPRVPRHITPSAQGVRADYGAEFGGFVFPRLYRPGA